MATTKQRSRRRITADHHRAMMEGRQEARIVRQYLEYLATGKDPRGEDSKKDAEERCQLLESKVRDRSMPVDVRIEMAVEMAKLEAFLAGEEATSGELEQQFVAVAPHYTERKHLDRHTWEILGVPEQVLDRAGIEPDSNKTN